MFSLNAHQSYYIYSAPTDMRKGFNGLSGLVRNKYNYIWRNLPIIT
ncbi:MAG: IS66 family insertion sequence element accessory protein TnpB [Saprospiraceae bacterium]